MTATCPGRSERRTRPEGPAQPRRFVENPLEEAVRQLCAVETDDTAAVLRAAWHGFAALTAAGDLLALRTPAHQYRAHRRAAAPLLHTAFDVLNAAPHRPGGRPPAPSGSSATDQEFLAPEAATAVREAILALTLALGVILSSAAQEAALPGDARACRQAAALARELTECFRDPALAEHLGANQ